jgi:peptidoglycan hydrolase CwlO-like protein
MRKIVISMMSAIIISLTIPVTAKAEDLSKEKTSVSIVDPAIAPEAKVLQNRLEEIQAMEKAGMTRAQKKELRNEVKEIKSELAKMSGGIYLSVGAIIIIILLLILLL